MATEAEYSEMWAQDATAMYNYAASSADRLGLQDIHVAAADDESERACRQAGAVRSDRRQQGADDVDAAVRGNPSPAAAGDSRIIVWRRDFTSGSGQRGVAGIVGGFRPD